ncbi:hypothetical protein FBZ87_102262 [Nitrospirillum amazonense]|uniref:Uncharacterized protein n=1 Tax=Nitrospirillum amazonense TaxID=28077 RepID=A0A560KGT4_9PROT|nr:hypothetical protein [Nitrospirillum amazonense]TWB79840.1 hypothetical protein FBZ87_102262 [Nitrospirillum amazonense]
MPQAPRRVARLLVAALLPILGACALNRGADDAIGLSSTAFFGRLTNQADIREPSLAEATTVELQVRASPEGRDTDGRTLSDRVARYGMPATARWLAAHGQATALGGRT